jgi:hypothetical protein
MGAYHMADTGNETDIGKWFGEYISPRCAEPGCVYPTGSACAMTGCPGRPFKGDAWPFAFFADPRNPLSVAARGHCDLAPAAAVSFLHSKAIPHD